MKLNFGVIEMFNCNSKVIAQLLILLLSITITITITLCSIYYYYLNNCNCYYYILLLPQACLIFLLDLHPLMTFSVSPERTFLQLLLYILYSIYQTTGCVTCFENINIITNNVTLDLKTSWSTFHLALIRAGEFCYSCRVKKPAQFFHLQLLTIVCEYFCNQSGATRAY